jgi:signal transduction histidine kinase
VRPPLTKRLKLRHWVALDCLVAVPVALIMYVALHRNLGGPAGAPMVALLALATAVAVALRRLRPLAALAVLLGISMLVQLTVVDNANQFPVFPAVAYVLYLVAAVLSRKVAGLALCASLSFLLAEALLATPAGVGAGAGAGKAAIPLALVLVVAWAFGSMMRQRRAYATDMQQQAAGQAVAEERLRIARELHDVVAHSMSVIAVQAGFGSYVIDDQPAKAREALGAIQATSRDALDEMRRMLSVLRQPGPGPAGDGRGRPARLRLADLAADPAGGQPGPGAPPDGGADGQRPPAAPLRPAPGLADLDRLLARVGYAGVHVDLQVSGERRAVPAGVDLSAFRIVQEALTNVVKHAATPDCRVTLDYGPDELCIEVVDEGRGCALPVGARPGSGSGAAAVPPGHGLIGMGERVHLCGGQFTAGPRPDHGFRVAATLPLSGGPA